MIFRSHPPCGMGGWLLSSLALVAFAALAPAPSTAQPPAEATAATKVPAALVRVQAGSVTIRARDAAITQLLAEIARQSDLEVTVYGILSTRATVDIERLPMREAMDSLLRGLSFALRYQPPSTDTDDDDAHEGRSSTNHLWVFTKEGSQTTVLSGSKAEAPPPDTPPLTIAAIDRLLDQAEEADGLEGALDGLIAAALEAEKRSVRAEAVHGLGEFEHPDVVPVLEQALLDPEERVREAAIEALSNVGGADAAWALATALDDPSASLRREAIYALTDSDEQVARILVERALGDGHPSVREAAIEALEELAEASDEESDADSADTAEDEDEDDAEEEPGA